MAHDICTRDGKVHMMYVGEVPWHGLGKPLGQPATSAEAIKAANLDWRVKKIELYAAEFGRRMVVEGTYGLVRDDLWRNEDADCPIFGLVSEAYTPVQNREAFAFFDSIVGEGAAVYHTAGALGDGERVWMLAKLPGHIQVIGEDVTDKYLLFTNDHRGEGAVRMKFTPVRVVCQNTLAMALKDGATVRIMHHRNVKEKLEAAKELLGLIDTRYTEIGESFRAMLRVPVNAKLLGQYLALVFPEPKDDREASRKRVMDARALPAHLFSEGQGNQSSGVAGTLWAAFNGVTELIDHQVPRNAWGAKANERRMVYAPLGGGASIKTRAYELALAKPGTSYPFPVDVRRRPERLLTAVRGSVRGRGRGPSLALRARIPSRCADPLARARGSDSERAARHPRLRFGLGFRRAARTRSLALGALILNAPRDALARASGSDCSPSSLPPSVAS